MVKQYVHLMQSMMVNAATFQHRKKKKCNVTINSSTDLSDEEEQNFQVTNIDVDKCFSNDDKTRSAMCKILGGMMLQSKLNH
jgi:hypothetical protein